MDLVRENYDAQGAEMSNGFSQNYTSTNWRVGVVYNLRQAADADSHEIATLLAAFDAVSGSPTVR